MDELRLVRLGDSELELAVFRFTLGIPGFDDTFIPRVVGSFGILILIANHLLGPDTVSETQTRSEVFAAVLATICIASPTIEARLKELEPGRGRQAAPQEVQGAISTFAIADSVSEEQKQELAWASYALLRNTNTCGVAVFRGQQAVMARGAFGPAAKADGPQACLQTLSKAQSSIKKQLTVNSSKDGGQLAYFQDTGALSSAGVKNWAGLVPTGVNSILMCQGATSSDNGVLLVLLSDRPRAWSRRERLWGLAVTKKLEISMQ
ncbi:MAG: required for cyt b6 assembly [Trebouxia sp. A1-2]|nr:MAG: required for cyt b6 assembly [Trebouxia sp. A1-2]